MKVLSVISRPRTGGHTFKWSFSLWLATGLMLLCTLMPAQAQTTPFALGVYGGSTGIGGQLTYSLFENLNLRAGYNFFRFSTTIGAGGQDFDLDLTLSNAPILVDYHIFNGTFHLTGGIYINQNNLEGNTTITKGATIGGTTLTVTESFNADIDMGNTVAPYFGIGWGNAVEKGKHWGFNVDIGAYYQGTPDVTLKQTSNNGFTASAADLKAEENEIQDALDDFVLYPVITMGISYHF